MTLLEAGERAVKIWGPLVTLTNVAHWDIDSEWIVEVFGHQFDHGLDCNGHVTCDHRECIDKERKLS